MYGTASVDTDYFRPPTPEERCELRTKQSLHENDIIVLYMGRLIYRKRVDLPYRNESRAGIRADHPKRDSFQLVHHMVEYNV